MKPIPIVFHLGPLQIHTYGIGLALTFWFAYRYFSRRLKSAGYPSDWLGATFIYIVISAVIGARAVHVIANFGFYSRNVGDIFAIWHGGLSSFGGLLFGIPVGFLSAHRRCPQLRARVAADLVAPVLAIAWAMGRLLGPQLMIAGGGKPTSAWFGMYYAGQIGKRLPVPIFQAVECFAIYLIAVFLERSIRRVRLGSGIVTCVVVGLWGLSRFFDEYLWLTHDNGTDAVEIASLCLFALGVGGALFIGLRRRIDKSAEQDNPAIGVGASS